jgi:hypothetical protein
MNFWDKFGRLHTKPVTDTNPLPTNNAYIYTAYYSIFDKVNIPYVNTIRNHPIGRHPYGLKPGSPPMSHDELYGLSILDDFQASRIVEYLEDNHNQYCDLPGFEAKPFWKLNPFKVIPAFYKLSKEPNPRKVVINYPETWNIAFYQRPEHRWFYKRCAGIEPTLFEKIIFTLSRLVSILRWKKEEPNVLLYFSMVYLVKSGFDMGFEGKMISRLTAKKAKSLYRGINDMLWNWKDLSQIYYKRHPLYDVVNK